MASKSSIAIRRNSAIGRCKDAIQAIWGEEVTLPLRHRDMSMLGALQMEAIADYLTCKAFPPSIEIVEMAGAIDSTPAPAWEAVPEMAEAKNSMPMKRPPKMPMPVPKSPPKPKKTTKRKGY